jgi:hypothetical protein
MVATSVNKRLQRFERGYSTMFGLDSRGQALFELAPQFSIITFILVDQQKLLSPFALSKQNGYRTILVASIEGYPNRGFRIGRDSKSHSG